MFMRFWSEISRMFFSMFLGLIILRLKMCILYDVGKSMHSTIPSSSHG